MIEAIETVERIGREAYNAAKRSERGMRGPEKLAEWNRLMTLAKLAYEKAQWLRQLAREGKPMPDDLDAFTRGYIEAALFTNCHADNPELDGKGLDDFALETLIRVKLDCEMFQHLARHALASAYEQDKTPEQAGRDFWYTRCGHGVGFWERDRWPEPCGSALDLWSKTFGNVDMYAGDDGKIYLA